MADDVCNQKLEICLNRKTIIFPSTRITSVHHGFPYQCNANILLAGEDMPTIITTSGRCPRRFYSVASMAKYNKSSRVIFYFLVRVRGGGGGVREEVTKGEYYSAEQ